MILEIQKLLKTSSRSNWFPIWTLIPGSNGVLTDAELLDAVKYMQRLADTEGTDNFRMVFVPKKF